MAQCALWEPQKTWWTCFLLFEMMRFKNQEGWMLKLSSQNAGKMSETLTLSQITRHLPLSALANDSDEKRLTITWIVSHQATGSHTAAHIQSSVPFRWNDLFHLNWPKTEEGLWDGWRRLNIYMILDLPTVQSLSYRISLNLSHRTEWRHKDVASRQTGFANALSHPVCVNLSTYCK